MTRAQILRELTNKDFNPIKPLTVGKDGHLLLDSSEQKKTDPLLVEANQDQSIDISTLFDEPKKTEQEVQTQKKSRIRINGKFVKSL